MGETTAISWTDRTFNPWMGCHRVSAGCDNCYMFRDMPGYGRDPAKVVRTTTVWKNPKVWEKEVVAGSPLDLVFTCSWSDWFINEADAWRPEAWALVRDTPHLFYQILTKRPQRILDHLPPDWGDGYPNVLLGVSAEDAENAAKRIPLLLKVPAKFRFLSCEPLLSAVDLKDLLSTGGIHQVITGGESGAEGKIRRMDPDWARGIGAQAADAGVPHWHKQNGGNTKCACHKEWGCRLLDGREIHQYPKGYVRRVAPAGAVAVRA